MSALVGICTHKHSFTVQRSNHKTIGHPVSNDLGLPLPGVATPSPSNALIYSSRTASPIVIYSSRTAWYVPIRTLGVVTPGSGDPWEWWPVTCPTPVTLCEFLLNMTFM